MTQSSPEENTQLKAGAPGSAAPVEVSIIIVNYNVKDFLLQCLRSVEHALHGIAGEVIVVDNNSTDGSLEYLRPLFPQVQFIGLKENVGFANANNLALEKVRGDFVLFLNPDTLLEERTLAVMRAYMNEHPEAGLSGCRVLNSDGTLQLACRRSFPTPWASFCKVFGLQRLFPHSRLFAQYNQTFRRPDETYFVDAISGAFMFGRSSALKQSGGFDPEFFMYGEDLDLCYRITKAGWKIAYVPDTSVIHYKGASTQRSHLNKIAIFYEAMELFARKHHSSSALVLHCLRLGILLRSLVARANLYRRSLFVLAWDLLSINGALLLATKLRFGAYCGFPPYAYPVVFVALSVVTLGSMLIAGEYFEPKPSLRRAVAGLLVNFFLLTALTYFFKDFAFSRGVLLMLIAAGIISVSGCRMLLAVYDRSLGRDADRRIAIVGMTEPAAEIIRALQTADRRNANLVGIVRSPETTGDSFCEVPVIGDFTRLPELIERYKLGEIIITDKSIQRQEVMRLIAQSSLLSARFHVALDYEDIVTARIINDVAGVEPTLPAYNLTRLRCRIAKRAFDLVAALFLLTLGLPVVYLSTRAFADVRRTLWGVLKGKYSIVGLYPTEGSLPVAGKIGLTGLAHISKPARVSPQVIRELNEYYVQHYTATLDFDILLKGLFRKG
jgi:GT2 family glycosyltransferase